VSLSNKSPSYSLGQLRDKFFGTFGDTVNLKTQLAACSRNKVTLGKMDAIEAFIPLPVSSSCFDVDRQVIAKYANQIAGYQLKLIVLPWGTYYYDSNNWSAYGYVYGDVSVYNDAEAINAEIQVHEVGHNFGLGHAYYNGKEYGDTSNAVRYFSVILLFFFTISYKQFVPSLLFFIIIMKRWAVVLIKTTAEGVTILPTTF
jgi:hypothetical protein